MAKPDRLIRRGIGKVMIAGSGQRFGRCFALLAMSAILTACVAHRSVENKYEKISSELEPGDRVEIVLRDGSETTFRVTEIRPTELVGDTSTDITRGEEVTVRYDDISRLERVDQRPIVVLGALATPFIILFIGILVVFATI
jgi:hypothetical protein